MMPKQTEYYDAVTQDVIPVDAVRDLAEFGFDATVLPLGGHTKGSIGLLIGEHLFSGDTVFGLGISLYPPFADCPNDIRAAWETILQTNAKYICPGHGPMVPMQTFEKQFNLRFGNTSL
jgi:glyoxylase-like metal-dependent hydrolase (beta-lactamase superfamily II)